MEDKNFWIMFYIIIGVVLIAGEIGSCTAKNNLSQAILQEETCVGKVLLIDWSNNEQRVRALDHCDGGLG